MTPTDAAHATTPGSSLSLRAKNALDGLMPANRMPRPSPTRPRTAAALAAACVSAVLVLASCAPEPNPVSAPASESFVDELEAPWSIAFHGDAALVSERDSARVLEIGETGEVHEVAVIDGVEPGGEGGLLGLAVSDGELFTYFTAQGENRVERRTIVGDAGGLSLGPATVVIDGIPAAGNHNGGRIAFGPDGMLYVTTGDAGDRDSAQDLDALSGKILRLTPEGEIPADNPFDDSPVYSYGHRNPQGIAWDAEGGMYASEFGQDTWDELNVIEPGGNYGWPEVEGIADDGDYIDPVQQWRPETASPSGIAVTGSSIVIANLRGERLRTVPLDDLTAGTEQLVGEFGRLRDVVVGPGGDAWILTNNTDGRGDPSDGDDRILRLSLD
nr:PQQ-dependent sugar dehydrogenase [Microbacterium sp. A(2022)]